jgi:hypothetical protein
VALEQVATELALGEAVEEAFVVESERFGISEGLTGANSGMGGG